MRSRAAGSRSSAKRGRSPQETDLADLGGEEWLEPVIVEVEGRDVWLGAESETEEAPWEPPAPRRRLLRRLEGIAVLAALAVVVFVLLPNRGWRGLDEADQARTEARLSSEAGRIAGHPARAAPEYLVPAECRNGGRLDLAPADDRFP